MSRYYWGDKKTEADYLKQVSVFFIKKHGYLNYGTRSGNITWSNNGEQTARIGIESLIIEEEKYIRMIYTQTDRDTGSKEDFDYKIPLTTTKCFFGGERYWFTCPWYVNGKYCGRRVGVLYLGGKHFACRHCHNLSYESRNENKQYRYNPLFTALTKIYKAEKLEERMKTRYYAGKPTRKYKKWLKLRAGVDYSKIQMMEEGLLK